MTKSSILLSSGSRSFLVKLLSSKILSQCVYVIVIAGLGKSRDFYFVGIIHFLCQCM